jgi:hypothetical protein
MNVLISGEFEQQARDAYSARSLKNVVQILERLSRSDLALNPMIHRLPDVQDIFVMRYGDQRFFFTIRDDDVLLVGLKNIRIDVSKGQQLKFAANGNPVSGVIVASKKEFGPWASIIVETESPIPENAQLTIPDLPETGGCGLAHPKRQNGRTSVELSIGYSYIDSSTIGK